MVDEAFAKAHQLLEKNRSLLDKVAGTLIEKETIEKTMLETLLSTGELPPEGDLAPAEPPAEGPQKEPAKQPKRRVLPRPEPQQA